MAHCILFHFSLVTIIMDVDWNSRKHHLLKKAILNSRIHNKYICANKQNNKEVELDLTNNIEVEEMELLVVFLTDVQHLL